MIFSMTRIFFSICCSSCPSPSCSRVNNGHLAKVLKRSFSQDRDLFYFSSSVVTMLKALTLTVALPERQYSLETVD